MHSQELPKQLCVAKSRVKERLLGLHLQEKPSFRSLPTGIRLPVTAGLFRATVYVIHTWFGLINILQRVVGRGDPGAVAVRHRVGRQLFEVSRLDEVIERLRRFLL